ncbi:MAG: hypothetical protein ACW98D_18895 [Promethearchaeota archaeon]|jgi:hypothetical protein
MEKKTQDILTNIAELLQNETAEEISAFWDALHELHVMSLVKFGE